MFDILVDPVRAAIFAAAQLLGGSLGAGIMAISALLRLALLPITLRVARRSNAQQLLLRSIKPELEALQKRHQADPAQLMRETQAAYLRAGVRTLDPLVLLGGLARVPVLGAIYGALRTVSGGRFGWISDLAKPDLFLVFLVAGASGLAALLGSQVTATNARTPMLLAGFAATLSLVFFWHLSSALLLSWGASAAVDIVQGALLLRERRNRPR